MAGLGKRFQMKGFSLPKPLIDINGIPMIVKVLDSLELSQAQFLFVIAKNEYSEHIKSLILQKLLKLVKWIGLFYRNKTSSH